ncbi:MAG: hypothetical protein JJE46_04455 [Acidimicrobiia bacterium]|nr:hypothetical protein [Acidimicrobiia bacterium]
MSHQDVVLTIPGSVGFVRLARLAAADSGARVGMPVEDIEDLRIAVDELCFAMSQGAADCTIQLTFRVHDDAVEVFGTTTCAVGTGELSELARTIVSSVVDDYDLSSGPTERQFRMRKAVPAG